MNKTLLSIKDLYVQYVTDDNIVNAVNGLNIDLVEGESLGLVGETGAGKTTTALSIMQLLPQPAGIITKGEIIYNDKNLVYNTEKDNIKMRGEKISMIFQDPMTALNPTMSIGKQMLEVLDSHKNLSKKEAKDVCIDMLKMVGIGEERFNDYPHQLSGGMKQRVVIAMALLCQPEILIADEPTTALDVTIQAQILNIIRDLMNKFKMSMMLITHDLGIVAETCERIAVMYAGTIVESGTVLDVYDNPKHPYTIGLFDSIPKIDDDSVELNPIKGTTPNPADLPSGCKFHPRCKYCQDICRTEEPEYKGEGHIFKCHFNSLGGEV